VWWNEMVGHLSDFESVVLTGVDAEGYPYSVRNRPRIDPFERVLLVRLPAGTPVQPGPASLLCHRHDENLWNLKSFLVRGTLARGEDGEWTFRPERFVPGAGIGGPMAMVRFVAGARKTAGRYLEKRGLPRPRIPWDDINAIKAQIREGGPPSNAGG
jgi:hypothetical protein